MQTTFNEAKKLAEELTKLGYTLLPISLEMYADMYTPMEVMKTLKGCSKHCFILESAEDSQTWGRYTFLGFDPTMTISCLDGMVVIEKNGEQSTQLGDPTPHIRKVLAENKAPSNKVLDSIAAGGKPTALPPFCGGLVGYFAYDYAKYCEPSLQQKLKAEDRCYFRDVDLMLFDKIIAFDHLKHKIVLIANMRLDTGDFANEYSRASLELNYLSKLLRSGTRREVAAGILKSDFTPLFNEKQFCDMVDKAKDYIKSGDITQVVLSNRFEADFEGSLFDAYRVLRTINPSPYMFYFSGTDFEFAGASPETLVKLQDDDGKRNIYTYPLGGTRARGKTLEEDVALEKELLADKKELHEHDLLVELGHEDLNKVCVKGSVKTAQYMNILRFSHVMHIGSVVSGELAPEYSGLDAIAAVLPAGTLSGAPKIRSMEIIDELEKNKRGIYGGAIGYLDFTGNMDTCIAIRLAYKKGGKVYVRSGAGVVDASVPASEHQECLNKAAAVKFALEAASGGID